MAIVINMNSDLEKELEHNNFEVHIKIQQRNGRKTWTSVEGLDKIDTNKEKLDIFFENITKHLKKKFNCGATIKKPEYFIQLNGDHRDGIKEFLIKEGIVNESQIKMHGF